MLVAALYSRGVIGELGNAAARKHAPAAIVARSSSASVRSFAVRMPSGRKDAKPSRSPIHDANNKKNKQANIRPNLCNAYAALTFCTDRAN